MRRSGEGICPSVVAILFIALELLRIHILANQLKIHRVPGTSKKLMSCVRPGVLHGPGESFLPRQSKREHWIYPHLIDHKIRFLRPALWRILTQCRRAL